MRRLQVWHSLLKFKASSTRAVTHEARLTGQSVRRRQQAVVVGLHVTVEPAGGNSRRCYAGINISAPVECVWNALTDYDGLGNFIPGTDLQFFAENHLVHLC